MIQLDSKSGQQKISDLFDQGAGISFFNFIKIVEKEHPLPKFKEAYYTFSSGTADAYTEKIREYDNACLLRDFLIKRLAEDFVQMHAREAAAPTSKYWVLPENELDFSIESLNILDRKNTYTSNFKEKFCTSDILPLLTGYILHCILKNTVQHGWEMRYADNLYHVELRPSAGSKMIAPCDYIKSCFYSGFKYAELYHCLQSNTVGLSENYKPWRRQYLSDVSNP
ncbi:MAG TPA: hypothetical protein VK826_00640 [Bacteroidia bacterium]|nr:hypothetical protein [Bacteroidia bacterium]